MDSTNTTGFVHSKDLETALEKFANSEEKTVTPEVIKIIEVIAETGLSSYNWTYLRKAIGIQLNQIVQTEFTNFRDKTKFTENFQLFLTLLEQFDNAPFTVQRLCELVLHPSTYTIAEKYLHALEKVLSVSSTMAQLSENEFNEVAATLVKSKPAPAVNGKEENTDKNNNDDNEMEVEANHL